MTVDTIPYLGKIGSHEIHVLIEGKFKTVFIPAITNTPIVIKGKLEYFDTRHEATQKARKIQEVYQKIARVEERISALEDLAIPDEALDVLINGADDERELVTVISQYLLTDTDKCVIDAYKLNIEKVLNGEFNSVDCPAISPMLKRWNARIGKKVFFTFD